MGPALGLVLGRAKVATRGTMVRDDCRGTRRSAHSAPASPQILGGGPNRIGQGIEFDYCCCHTSFALRKAGFETIMMNSNPETVSTDYDTSDRLYFEPLTVEDVLNVIELERPNGVIVQFGGQTPLKLATPIQAYLDSNPIKTADGTDIVRIWGTQPDAIDEAEDRNRWYALLKKLDIRQPAGAICATEVGGCALLRRTALCLATCARLPSSTQPCPACATLCTV